MSKCVAKRGGSKKYVLAETYEDFIPFDIECNFIGTGYAEIWRDGFIRIKEGYEWDGPSGPTIDTDDFMDGALVHDVLYQMIREGHLPMRKRKEADQVLRTLCLVDGMPKWRACYVYYAVRWFGRSAAKK
jgi:hypothetical protein